MNTTRILSISVLVISMLALTLVSAQGRELIERAVLFLLPVMGIVIGVLINEEFQDTKPSKS